MRTNTNFKKFLIRRSWGGLLLFLLFSCTEENYITLPQPNKGLVNVYIEGDITTAEAQAKLDVEVGSITENIYVQNTSQVTAVAIKPVANIRNVHIKNNTALKSVELIGNGIKMNEFWITQSTKINNIKTSGIYEAYLVYFNFVDGISSTNPNALDAITIACNDLETITSWLELHIGWNLNQEAHHLTFPHLKRVNTQFYNDLYSRWQGNFATFNMPKLEQLHNVQVQTKINNLSFPMLKKANKIGFGWGAADIGQINLPVLEEISEKLWASVRYLTINFPLLSHCKNISLFNDINSIRINEILHQFLNIQPTSGKEIQFFIQNHPDNPSFNFNQSPTGQGLIDKQILINQGNTVSTY